MIRALFVALLLTGAWSRPVHGQNFGLLRSVVGNGGTSAAAPLNGLSGTCGQSDVGMAASQNFVLCSGFWCRPGLPASAVADLVLRPPLNLGNPWPNPTAGMVHLALSLPTPSSVQLEVFDLMGRRVHVKPLGIIGAGLSDLAWNEPGDRGQWTGAGIYFVRVVVNGRTVGSRKLMLRR